MRRSVEMQRLVRQYREEIGEQSINTHDVAKWAAGKGWPVPAPKTGLERLAEQFSGALREEYRKDPISGRPYRANLAVIVYQGKPGEQFTLWTDIDEAPRHVAQKAFVQRREQMVGDAVHLADDIDHWNRVNPKEKPIQMPLDLTPDVDWRRNSGDDAEKAA